MSDKHSLPPEAHVVLLMVRDGLSFNDAFIKTNDEYLKQFNKQLPREKIAKLVLGDLEKLVPKE